MVIVSGRSSIMCDRAVCARSQMCDWLLAGRETEHVLINVSETPRAPHEDTSASFYSEVMSGYKVFRCVNNNFLRDSRQFAFVIWTFKSDPVTSASPVFKTTCNWANVCYDFFQLQLYRCTTLNLCHTALFAICIVVVCMKDKQKPGRDVYLQLMEDFLDERMTRSGTAAFSLLDSHHVIYTVWLFISCSTTGNFVFFFFKHFHTSLYSTKTCHKCWMLMINCECTN